MCGIFGFWQNSKLTDPDIKRAHQCLSLLNHRGPDNQSFWVDKNQENFSWSHKIEYYWIRSN